MPVDEKCSVYNVEFPTESSSSISVPQSHSTKHEYILDPYYSVVPGFVLNLDQVYPSQSKNQIDSEESQLVLKYLDLESDCCSDIELRCKKIPSTTVQYALLCNSVKLKKRGSLDCVSDIRRNGLNPSDLNISLKKSTQCCNTCLELQETCCACSGQELFRRTSHFSSNESDDISCNYVTSTGDEEVVKKKFKKNKSHKKQVCDKSCGPCISVVEKTFCDRSCSTCNICATECNAYTRVNEDPRTVLDNPYTRVIENSCFQFVNEDPRTDNTCCFAYDTVCNNTCPARIACGYSVPFKHIRHNEDNQEYYDKTRVYQSQAHSFGDPNCQNFKSSRSTKNKSNISCVICGVDL